MQTNLEWRKQSAEVMFEKRKRTQRRKGLLIKWFLTIVIGVLALLPTIGFFLFKNALNPQTFWEKFVVWGGGFVVLGGLQVGLIVLWIGLLIEAIWDA